MRLLRPLIVGLALCAGLVLLIPALILLVPILVVARLTRALSGLGGRDRASVPWPELVVYEPEVGWRPKENLDAYGRADDIFHLTTGSDGWRGDVPLEAADVVVFGDSYAFGHGADDDRMFTAFTRPVRVKPVGSDGYDMVHGLVWMERLLPDLRGKLVVWFVYYGNDLWESLLPAVGHYRKPFLRQTGLSGEDWEVVTEHVSPEPWPFPTRQGHHAALAEISCPGSDRQIRVASASEYLIERAYQRCAEVDADLIVVGVPDRVQLTRRGRATLERLAPKGRTFDVGLPDQMLRRACDRVGATFVPLSAHLRARDYLVQDIHWRTSGHRKVGRLLQELALRRREHPNHT